MELMINGQPRECDARNVDELLKAELEDGHTRRGIAVAVNGRMVPRSEWPRKVFSKGDSVEIVHALPGG
ncbi:sulfur carrier protein ThiS [Terrihabitans sp. B22-R8]|uniref:sulfur carrier protein ThiS n=1 Tax=Terrihabitans sp. B22-R8 TaxID=3425128 RepID=UPI00403CCC47